MAVAVIPEAAAAFADVVINAIRVATALAVNQAFQGAAPQVLPSLDWAHIAGIINTAYPGFTQPAKYDANTVGTLMAEMIAHISGETQGLYFGTLAIAQDIDTIQGELTSLNGQLRQVAGGAASETALINLSKSVAELGRTVNVDYAAAVAHANQLANTITGWLQGEESARARGDAITLGQANAHTDQVGATITGWLKTEEATRANADNVLRGQIVNGVLAAEGYALSTATALTTSMGAKILAQLTPQIAKINTELDECLAPMCDTVAPNSQSLGKLGNLLTAIEQAAVWAVLVALLAEAAHNPAQAVRDIHDGLSAVVGDTLGGLRNLIGI